MAYKRKTLAEISSDISYGYTASATDTDTGVKFVRITDIVPNTINWDSVPYCSIPESRLEKYLLKDGDIVVARTGATTGYAKLIKNHQRCIFASYLVRFRIKEEFCSRYVGYVIQSNEYKKYIKQNVGGAAQPNANAKILGSFIVPIPNYKTQTRIASILSNYDDLIEINQKRIKILEEMAQNLYREWFVHFRYQGHEKVLLTDSSLGPIPEGWEVIKLEDVCHLTMGQSPKSEFYNEEGKGLPFHQGVTDFGARFPQDRIYCTIQNRIAEPGDILFSVRAPVGRLNITNQKMVIGRGLSAIRHKLGYQDFLFHQLKEIFFKEDIMGSGSIFNAVTKKDMQNIDLLIPSEVAIQKYEDISKPISSMIATLDRALNNLASTRDLLLPKLISGELQISDVDIPKEDAA